MRFTSSIALASVAAQVAYAVPLTGNDNPTPVPVTWHEGGCSKGTKASTTPTQAFTPIQPVTPATATPTPMGSVSQGKEGYGRMWSSFQKAILSKHIYTSLLPDTTNATPTPTTKSSNRPSATPGSVTYKGATLTVSSTTLRKNWFGWSKHTLHRGASVQTPAMKTPAVTTTTTTNTEKAVTIPAETVFYRGRLMTIPARTYAGHGTVAITPTASNHATVTLTNTPAANTGRPTTAAGTPTPHEGRPTVFRSKSQARKIQKPTPVATSASASVNQGRPTIVHFTSSKKQG